MPVKSDLPRTFTLYALKNGSMIRSIKALRAVATLSGAELRLKPAKTLIENIERHPIVVSFTDNERAIVRLALEPYFEMTAPESEPVHLSASFEWPEQTPEPMTADYHCDPVNGTADAWERIGG